MKGRSKQNRYAAMLAAFTLCLSSQTAVFANPAEETGVSEEVSAQSETVYRLYNVNTGEHLYTSSVQEREQCIRYGWMDEGVGWIGALQGDPVYRLYNPNAAGGDHYYTKNYSEASRLAELGWKWDNEGRGVFCSSGDVPLYVAYNKNAASGTHNYTTDPNEQNFLLTNGWMFGETAWSVKEIPAREQPSSVQPSVVRELGEMKQPPIAFNEDGWIVFKRGKIGFMDAQGNETIPPKYSFMQSFFADDFTRSDYSPKDRVDLAVNEDLWLKDSRNSVVCLPFNHYDSDLFMGGGLGGAAFFHWYFDESSQSILYRPVPDSLDEKPVLYPLNEVPSEVLQNMRTDQVTLYEYKENQLIHDGRYWIWNLKNRTVTGPFSRHSLSGLHYAICWQTDQSGMLNMTGYYDELYGTVHERPQIYQTGNASYQRHVLYNVQENSGIVCFDQLMQHNRGFVGRIGQSIYVYDEHARLIYCGDFEDAGIPIGNLVPVKTGGTWKLITLESAKAQKATAARKPFLISNLVQSVPEK